MISDADFLRCCSKIRRGDTIIYQVGDGKTYRCFVELIYEEKEGRFLSTNLGGITCIVSVKDRFKSILKAKRK